MRRIPVACALVALVACTNGPPGPAGESLPGDPGTKGEPGEAYEPTLSQITPDLVYLGRDVDLLISGSGTEWSDPSTLKLELGEGITIKPDSIEVASSTALRVSVTIEPGAPTGLRDVRVVDDGEIAELEGAFVVDPSLVLLPTVVTAPGDIFGIYAHAFRGAVIPSAVVLVDRTIPFDFFSDYITLTVGSSTYHPYQLTDDRFAAFFFLEVDAKGELGPQSVIVDSGPPGATTRSATGFPALTVVEHLPLALQVGHNAVAVPAQDTPVLYEIDLPEAGLWNFTIAGAKYGANAALLPASGKFAEARDRAAVVPVPFAPPPPPFPPPPSSKGGFAHALAGPGKMYLTYGGSGYAPNSGYAFDIEVSRQDFSTVVALTEPGTTGAIAIPGEADWYSFQGNTGDYVRVTTGPAGPGDTCASAQSPTGTPAPPPPPPPPPGPPPPPPPPPPARVDTVVQIVASDGSVLGQHNDIDFFTSWCSRLAVDLPDDGTYYVRVSADPFHSTYATFPYRLDLEVQ